MRQPIEGDKCDCFPDEWCGLQRHEYDYGKRVAVCACGKAVAQASDQEIEDWWETHENCGGQ